MTTLSTYRGGMASAREASAWLRRRPTAVDGAIGLGLAAVSVPSMWVTRDLLSYPTRAPDAVGVLLVLLSCLPLTFRRRWPLQVLVVVSLASLLLVSLDYVTNATGAGMMIALYTVAAYRGGREALAGLLVAVSAALLNIPFVASPVSAVDITAVVGVAAASAAFGRSIAFRRAHVAELERHAGRLERARAADQRVALAEERARIARELHDVVAHSVSIMTVQAEAAQRVLDRDPARSRQAMAAVEATGRQALTEMRRVVGALRARGEDGDLGERSPPAGVADLPGLVEGIRAAGLRVDLTVQGEPRQLGAGADLTVFRVVQEALTNVLKHAGPTPAHVQLTYGAEDVRVLVDDRGRGLSAALSADRSAVGHGLLGMRERVETYGGELGAGERTGGGFRVEVRLPLEPDAGTRAGHRSA